MSLEAENATNANANLEEWVQNMVPEVMLAVESLELATPERVCTCLEQKNIKATRSQTEMVLEYGCRKGVMEEKRLYRLNPELRSAIKSTSGCSKAKTDNRMSTKSRTGRCCELDDCSYYNMMDSESELSEGRHKSESYDDEDYEEDDVCDSDFENDDNL